MCAPNFHTFPHACMQPVTSAPVCRHHIPDNNATVLCLYTPTLQQGLAAEAHPQLPMHTGANSTQSVHTGATIDTTLTLACQVLSRATFHFTTQATHAVLNKAQYSHSCSQPTTHLCTAYTPPAHIQSSPPSTHTQSSPTTHTAGPITRPQNRHTAAGSTATHANAQQPPPRQHVQLS
jgi:hypothetical protein